MRLPVPAGSLTVGPAVPRVDWEDGSVRAGVRTAAPVAVVFAILALLAMPHQPGTHSPALPTALAGHGAAMADAAGDRLGDVPADPVLALALGCAVLLIGLLIVRPGGVRRLVVPPPVPRARVAPARARPAGRGPPRALLAQICVLRT